VTSVFAARDLFSIAYKYDMYCGGPHPEIAEGAMTFDLTTGKKISFGDAFLTSESAQNGFMKRSTHRFPKAHCKPSEPIKWKFKLAQNAAVVWTDLGHPARACEVQTVIKFDELTSFLAINSPLRRLLDNANQTH
jgi:hypothetical protein